MTKAKGDRDDDVIAELWNLGQGVADIRRGLGIGGKRFYLRLNVLRDAGRLRADRPHGRTQVWDDHSKPPSDRKLAEKLRLCLMCGGQFMSEWPGHRVCTRCTKTAAWRGGM